MDANPPMERFTDSAAPVLDREEEDALQAFFTYHAPTDDEKKKYQSINDTALSLARLILAVCPKGPDRSAAVRLVREARMTANAAIACRGARLPY